MSNGAKQHITNVIYSTGAIIMTAALALMVPPGLAGDYGRVKMYFGLMIFGLVCSVPAAIANNYYRARVEQDEAEEIERLKVETKTLANVAPKPPNPAQSTTKSTHNK